MKRQLCATALFALALIPDWASACWPRGGGAAPEPVYYAPVYSAPVYSGPIYYPAQPIYYPAQPIYYPAPPVAFPPPRVEPLPRSTRIGPPQAIAQPNPAPRPAPIEPIRPASGTDVSPPAAMPRPAPHTENPAPAIAKPEPAPAPGEPKRGGLFEIPRPAPEPKLPSGPKSDDMIRPPATPIPAPAELPKTDPTPKLPPLELPKDDAPKLPPIDVPGGAGAGPKLPPLELPKGDAPKLPPLDPPGAAAPALPSAAPAPDPLIPAPGIPTPKDANPKLPPLTLPPDAPVAPDKPVEVKSSPLTGGARELKVSVFPATGTAAAGALRKVGFYNHTARDLSLTIEGKAVTLPAMSYLHAHVPASFTWAHGDKPAAKENVPAGAAGVDVVIREGQ